MKELVKLNRARQALAEAKNLEEIKKIIDISTATKAWVKAAGMGIDIVNDAQEIKIRSEIKAGEFLKKMEKNDGTPRSQNVTTPPTLDELGIHKMQSHRWQKMSDIDKVKLENYVETKKGKKEEITSSGVIAIVENREVRQFSGEYEWYTPEKYIKMVRNVMGSIDLDPATSEEANKTVGARVIKTKDIDGLQALWCGNVWINPPYCMPEVQSFAYKLIKSIHSEDVKQAIFLSNNSTDTKWWQKLFKECKSVCFTRGRISFYGEDSNSMPLRGQTFFYFGKDSRKFDEVFSEIGIIGVSQ